MLCGDQHVVQGCKIRQNTISVTCLDHDHENCPDGISIDNASSAEAHDTAFSRNQIRCDSVTKGKVW